ncbi:DMT family transporter [Pusillimonas sp. SM2304]|uniref:DMT family transporter n=1 Tax=Pusillimonas sp. SM2304 TaxID=3073241 RepID=UPI0028769716|nr:DMT family transporter [Pusillimonas sp. SM2304]MDS1139920.1 DMT family transporter [Pusillimonas sp. SM2304]
MSSIPSSRRFTLGPQQAGILLFFCGLVTFAFFDASSKYLLQTYPAPFLNIMRYSTVAVVGIIMLVRYGHTMPREPAHRWQLLLRGVALGTVGTCFMTALQWMPLAEATAIYFTSPLIVVALSPWLLSERLTRAKWVAVVTGFAGMLLIVRPGNELPWLGTLLMVVSAVSFALFQLLTRRLSSRVPNHIQYAYTAFICFIITALPAPFFLPDPWPGALDLLFIVSLGLCNATGQLLLIAAFQRVAASTLAPFNYCQLLMAVAFSMFWFQQTPDLPALAGIALIIAAGVFLATRPSGPPNQA